MIWQSLLKAFGVLLLPSLDELDNLSVVLRGIRSISSAIVGWSAATAAAAVVLTSIGSLLDRLLGEISQSVSII